jgi:RNA polymerase subunit RPABC4/transcription elongation factor Spt4
MSLGACPDCGHQVSSNAYRCPKCGNDNFRKEIKVTEPAFCSMCDGSTIINLNEICPRCQGTGIGEETNYFPHDVRSGGFSYKRNAVEKLKSEVPARKAKRIEEIQKEIERKKEIKRGGVITATSYFVFIPIAIAPIGMVVYALVVFFYRIFDGQGLDRAYNEISWSGGLKWGLLAGLIIDGILGLIYLINKNKYSPYK